MATYVDLDTTVITVSAGEDLIFKFQVKDVDSVAVDITGWTFSAWLRDEAVAANIIAVVNASFTITTPASGLVQFPLTRAQTLSLGCTRYKLTLWRTDSGLNDNLCEGVVVFKATVRPTV